MTVQVLDTALLSKVVIGVENGMTGALSLVLITNLSLSNHGKGGFDVPLETNIKDVEVRNLEYQFCYVAGRV